MKFTIKALAIGFFVFLLPAIVGAKLGGDAHDSLKCHCNVGWVSYDPN